MVYVKNFYLPSDSAEINFIKNEKRTCFNTFYPFNIFPNKELKSVDFDTITIFYGSNGSGKSTLLNLIAEKIGAFRYSEFNSAPLFESFVEMCRIELYKRPKEYSVLTSDDVFDYVIKARSVNSEIDNSREELFSKYREVHDQVRGDHSIMNLKGLDDYERWKETIDILSPKRSQSKFIKSRLPADIDLMSNGQTALRYFIDKIEEDAVYLLDEPENSLSIEFQMQLADYISATARSARTQFIIATHSPILLSIPNATIYDLDSCPVTVKHWTDLHNVRRYFDFFMDHKDEFE